MSFASQFEGVTVGSLTKKIKKGYWHVCMRCGRTVSAVNRDGECKECVKEIEKDRRSGYGQKQHYSDHNISDIY